MLHKKLSTKKPLSATGVTAGAMCLKMSHRCLRLGIALWAAVG